MMVAISLRRVAPPLCLRIGRAGQALFPRCDLSSVQAVGGLADRPEIQKFAEALQDQPTNNSDV